MAAWLDRNADGLPPAELIKLFDRAFRALWHRAQRTLGEVTLMAIGDRVLVVATEKYPFLATLELDETGIRVDEFLAHDPAPGDRSVREGVRFVLVEFLTVLGNLTDEILSPALHAELSKVVLANVERVPEQPRRGSRVAGSGDVGAARAEGASS